MTDQHPITPPLKVIQEWMFDLHFSLIPHPDYGQMDAQPHWIELVERAAQWGADQELAACCVLLDEWGLDSKDLMECRRPKPPSLKEPPTDDSTVVMLERLRAEPDDHKDYEGYEDGWTDACNAAIAALLTTQTKPPTDDSTVQVVMDAANGASSYGPDDCLNESRWIAAAALRAAADQLINIKWSVEMWELHQEFYAIATELESS